MEVASYLSDKASSVECIDIAAVPFERVLGTRIGKSLQQVGEGICYTVSTACSSVRVVVSIHIM